MAADTSIKRPRRLLAIDGGGLLGLIPAESLVQVEQQLNELTGEEKLLCDRFDLIGGTSTGAILAAGLALGMTAAELSNFYVEYGAEIFTKEEFPPIRFWHSYSSGPLEKLLQEKFGTTTTLGDSKLRTQVLIVTKNVTQGNDWFFTNNPKSKFFSNNSSLPLWQVVRASTAAPTYFPPHAISIPDPGGNPQTCEFVDGGVSSYNNPALQVFLEATVPEYGNGWPMGADRMLLLSMGTGFNSMAIDEGKACDYNLLDWAKYMVKELMNEANLQQNVLMHLIGQRPPSARPATTELISSGATKGIPDVNALDLISQGLGAQKLLTYQRITIGLTEQRLKAMGLGNINAIKVREMDAADQIDNMKRIGVAVAKEQVNMEALKDFFV